MPVRHSFVAAADRSQEAYQHAQFACTGSVKGAQDSADSRQLAEGLLRKLANRIHGWVTELVVAPFMLNRNFSRIAVSVLVCARRFWFDVQKTRETSKHDERRVDPELSVCIELLDPSQGHPVITWNFLGKSVISIGRLPDQDIHISDLHVSRTHAVLRFVENRWQISSLGKHGIYLGGAKSG